MRTPRKESRTLAAALVAGVFVFAAQAALAQTASPPSATVAAALINAIHFRHSGARESENSESIRPQYVRRNGFRAHASHAPE